jgi:hypothetical protein
MSRGKELTALIDLIYEAVLDNDLWPSVLIKLADALGAAHVVLQGQLEKPAGLGKVSSR